MQFIRTHKRTLITTAIVLALFLAFYETGFTARIVFPYGIIDKIRSLISGDHISFAASEYKDGTILLIKPIATGVGEGRYEAGDIVSILDGEEMFKRFGDSEFLGYEEKSKLIPLYLAQKLTEEQKAELLASEYAPAAVIPSSAESGTSPAAAGEVEDAPDRRDPSVAALPQDDKGKMTKRRQYGVDYTLVLSDKDILTIRQEKALDKIPEVKFEEIINKGTKLSYVPTVTHPVSDPAAAVSDPPLFLEGIYAGVAMNEKIPSNKRGAPSRVEGRGVYCESSASVVCLPKHLAIMEKAIKTTKLLTAIIVPNVRAATESVKTVDTGGYADYTSLSAWEAAEQADLTVSDTIAIAKCQHKTATSTADTTGVDITGWTTDATRYIKIWTDPTEDHRHNGKWSDDKYNLSSTATTTLMISEDYVRLDGLQIYTSGTPTGNGVTPVVYNGTTNTNDIQISNCILRGHNNATYWQNGFTAGNSHYVTLKIWNTIVYNLVTGGSGVYVYGSESTPSYIYNVTISGGSLGLRLLSGTAYAKNVLARNTLTADFQEVSGTLHLNNCASEDLTADDQDGDGVSGNNRVGQNFVFADVANNDFHLYATNATAQNYGTSSVAEIGFTTDIDGQTRPSTGSGWDIGADEMIATPIYRSVGPGNTNAISTGWSGTTLTINGSTATFSTDQPNNMGVGDVIVYANNEGMGTAATNSVAFIHGRNGPRSYTVKDAAGWMASSTYQATTKWAIYRAYTSLANAEAGTENSGLPDSLEHFDVSWSAVGGKNLASSTETWNIACYGDAADTAAAVTISDWTTSTSTYIYIYTPYLTTEVGSSQRHGGKWDSGKYNLTFNHNEWPMITIYEENVTIDGLQIYNTGIDAWSGIIQVDVSGAAYMTFANNIWRGAGTDSQGAGFGATNGGTASRFNFYNNIIYDINHGANDSSGGLILVGSPNYEFYVYNNTIVNTYRGIWQDNEGANPLVIAKNNLAYGNVYDYAGNNYAEGSINNLSSDTTAPGTNAKKNAMVNFVDRTGKDFHLAHSDSNAKDAGADMSADTNLPFSTDIDGNTRPSGRAWDIGADEATAGAVAGVNPYSKLKDPSLVGYWSFDGQDIDWDTNTAFNRNGQTISFPSTSVLDNFNRANQGPPPSTNWSQGMSGVFGEFAVVSNQAVGTVANGYAFSFWNPENFGPDSEVYATIASKPANGNRAYIGARLNNWTDWTGVSGYYLQAEAAAGTDVIRIARLNGNGTSDNISSDFSQEFSSGDSIGLTCVGHTITAYYKPAAGSWTALGSVEDSTYTSDGAIMMGAYNGSVTFDDFGGGTIENNNGALTGCKPSIGSNGQGISIGSNDSINLGTSASLQPANITVSYWLKRTSSWNGICGSPIVYASLGWGGNGWFVETNDRDFSAGLLMAVDGTNAFHIAEHPDTLYPLNEWVHIAATFNSTTNSAAMYINGVSRTITLDGTPDSITATTDNKFIGFKPSPETYLDGELDEVRIYNRDLSAAEIADLYRIGSAKAKTNTQIKTSASVNYSNVQTDNFNRSDQAPIAGNWSNDTGSFQIYSNVARSNAAPAMSYWSADTFSADQYAKAKLSNVASGVVGVAVRVQGTGSGYYFFSDQGSSSYFGKNESGTFNDIGGDRGAFAEGDVIGMTVQGTVVTLTRNNATIAVINDSTFSSGYPGISAWGTTIASVDDWEGGNYSVLNPTGIIGYWSFDGPDVNNIANLVYDRSGRNNYGTMINMATSSRYDIGMSGQALKFDGNDDMIILEQETITINDVTVCTWINPPPMLQWSAIIDNFDFSFGITITGAPYERVSVTSNYGTNAAWSADHSITTGVWQHACAVRLSNGLATLYVNGVQSGAANQNSGTPINIYSYPETIGANRDNDYNFTGKLDEIRIYNRALSADEISQIYRQGQRRTKMKAY